MDKYMKKSDVIAYIRKEAKEAQSAFEELGGESGIIAEAFEDLANELEDFPATDVAPARHGRWQYNTDFYIWCCSECGENPHKGTGVVTTAEKLPAYCPHCGAKMGDAE
jgi:rubrerythrin